MISRYNTVADLKKRLHTERRAGHAIGFLATMGALHRGHLTLADELLRHSQVRVCSIFVNPTQFNDPKDYETYFVNLDADEAALDNAGVDILFTPSVEEIYPSGFQTSINLKNVTQPFEGEHRPGHFVGVATVVAILLNSVRPDVSIFGEKDFQQLRVVEQMVADLKMDVIILRGKLVRELDGLAMSSRNVRLSPSSRIDALSISRGLFAAREAFSMGERGARRLEEIVRKELRGIPGLTEDYVAVADEETLEILNTIDRACRLLLVVRIQGMRLLDNIALVPPT